ncbi:SigE family RNA polymerase sigma factor [Catellatospora sp. NPDC049609]|uniref:SigE family RNA polymerase sigma factor n=1 Tax=Catellatospora sp. NPDC049609 TaxID=3155505 RepID=UPI0034486EE4
MRADEERAFTEYAQGRVLELRRTAYRLCGDWDQAHDLTQTALIRLYRHWARVSRADSPDAYVRRMLVNTFLDDRQSWWSRRVRPFAEPPDGPAPAEDVADRLDLMAALARLAPGQRAVIVLRYWEGLDVAETARVLGCSPGTVKSQTSYAIAALRRLLPNHLGGRA